MNYFNVAKKDIVLYTNRIHPNAGVLPKYIDSDVSSYGNK